MNVSESQKSVECRGAAMRRENWRVLFGNSKPQELPAIKEPRSYPPPLSSVSYISPFPGMKEKGRICFFERLHYHKRKWYFVVATDSDKEEKLKECNTNAQHNVHTIFQKKPFGVEIVTQAAMTRLIMSSNTMEKVVNTTQILINRFQPFSHGHIIQDSIIPLHHLMFQAGIKNGQNGYNIILDDEQVSDTSLSYTLATGPMMHDEWFKSVSPERRPMYIDEVDELLCPFQTHCVFSAVYTGFSDLNLLGPHLSAPATITTNVDSDLDPGAFDHRSRVLFDFNREAVENMLGSKVSMSLGDDASDDYGEGNIVVTFVQRRRSRIVVNLEEVKEEVGRVLFENFAGAYEVNIVAPEDLDPVSQVILVRNSTIFIAVEGGALDTLVYSRRNTVVVAWGRSPSLEMPEGGLIQLDEGNVTVDFWHELAFRNWARRAPEGLGMHIFPVMTPPGLNYTVDVRGTAEAVRLGLEKLKLHHGGG
ncbi:hypothetical protein TrCOL_g1737 [Triparma columacea]|nr:hypothetical protein TrCOL_g1737 [Triparma columacea]